MKFEIWKSLFETGLRLHGSVSIPRLTNIRDVRCFSEALGQSSATLYCR